MSESANGQANMPGQDGAGGPNGAAPGPPAGAIPAGASATGSAPSGRGLSGRGPSGSAPAGGAPAGGPTVGAPDGVMRGVPAGLRGTHYKWLALSNTTLGMLAATVNASIVIISLPAIFRGI